LGLGLGSLAATVDIVQMAPTASYEVGEHLAIGFAPTLTLAKIYASPLFLGAKDDADNDGDATFPAGVGTRYARGGGFQVGAYYTTDVGWHFGASVKSPQWVEPFRFNSLDELGHPRSVKFNLYYPLIASVGASYSGFDRWIFAGDLRYFDYGNTLGFADSGFNADGSVKGLGWRSIVSVALGAQRQVTDRLFLRGGYCYNGNPITPDVVEFNVASPLVVEHSVHTGFSYCFDDNWIIAMAYVHCFDNGVSGPLQTLIPGGATVPIPGTSVSTRASADVVSLGLTKRF
jgi:long-chain fatty acid transport protein